MKFNKLQLLVLIIGIVLIVLRLVFPIEERLAYNDSGTKIFTEVKSVVPTVNVYKTIFQSIAILGTTVVILLLLHQAKLKVR